MTEDVFLQAARILDQLREVELSVADLYRRFAGAFGADRIFWQDLARDEDRHAELASELKGALLKNGAPFEVVRLSPALLATFRQGIDQQHARFQRGEISRRAALFIARDFEKALVEYGFYDAIRSEKPDCRLVQERIRRETEGHFQKLQNYILTIFP
jgi:rubrerythrin